jgi:hypothetical protein
MVTYIDPFDISLRSNPHDGGCLTAAQREEEESQRMNDDGHGTIQRVDDKVKKRKRHGKMAGQ